MEPYDIHNKQNLLFNAFISMYVDSCKKYVDVFIGTLMACICKLQSSLDLVISCLGLHWTNDLPGAMIQVSFFRVVMVLSIVIDVSKLKSDGPGAMLCLLKCSVTQKVH